MAEVIAATITAKITAVSENGLKVEGYENWFNLTNDYQGLRIPPLGTEIEFTYKPWQNPKSHKTAYYVNEIIPVTQVAAPVAQPAPSSYDGLQRAAATAPLASTPAPTPTPVAEPPRNAEIDSPEPGSFPYRDLIGIPMSNSLNNAVALLVGVYGTGATERLTGEQLDTLAQNSVRLGGRLYTQFYKNSHPDPGSAPTLGGLYGAPPPEDYPGE